MKRLTNDSYYNQKILNNLIFSNNQTKKVEENDTPLSFGRLIVNDSSKYGRNYCLH